MTAVRGHGSLRTLTVFGERLHMDLVRGQKSIAPKDGLDTPYWFLLVVDEAIAWK